MLGHQNLHTVGLLLLLSISSWAINFGILKGDVGLQEGNVRLVGTGISSAGRVEVYHDGKWGTVCDDNWDMTEAKVVCRQLKFPGARSVVVGKDYGPVSGPIWLDEIHCNGTENYLVRCSIKRWGETDCTHKEDVGIVCEPMGTNQSFGDSLHPLDHTIYLSDHLGQIFDKGEACDFNILVQSPTQNQQNISEKRVFTQVCTHKIIMSQFPSFNSTQENTNVSFDISVPCQPYFTSFIRYIYTRKIDVNFSSALCLHWMAAEFGVMQLMTDVGRLFSKILSEDTSFHTQVQMYSYALETGDVALEEECLQYLAWNFQNLTTSPAWTSLSVELLKSLIIRSDLVVPDEYFVLQSVESFIMEQVKSITLETQAELLRYVRFPMIQAEKLYENVSSSPLYNSHKNLYNEGIMQALEFNVFFLTTLTKNSKFNKENADFHPRIYTADPWSTKIYMIPNESLRYQHFHREYNHYSHHGYFETSLISTPVHSSLMFKDKTVNWNADVLQSQTECSNKGVRCDTVPVARLASQNNNPSNSHTGKILYRNRLVVMCEGLYICQVLGFKSELIPVAMNGTQVVECPCPGGHYVYKFVVRPVYE
ncbi:galectin-3-binding protein A-like isoform X2 [Gouania willdenowi]|uniref:Galectin-3-binding protein A-like n=2 Tax=Gouania willdenowi TaxID=441366 RepID=A0A8C5GXI1_GOUWI|nr:galectin-3-binding protein A-like isoform X2 [Gouania willdenowi]